MRIILMIGIVIGLVSCTHKVALQTPNGQEIGMATLEFEGNSSGNISLVLNGVIYQGQWKAIKVDESGKIASNYGIGSKKYKDYISGQGNYLRSGQSLLVSENGEKLNCEFKYKGISAHGWCNSDTEKFEFMVKS
jgi:hypothetical protein